MMDASSPERWFVNQDGGTKYSFNIYFELSKILHDFLSLSPPVLSLSIEYWIDRIREATVEHV